MRAPQVVLSSAQQEGGGFLSGRKESGRKESGRNRAGFVMSGRERYARGGRGGRNSVGRSSSSSSMSSSFPQHLSRKLLKVIVLGDSGVGKTSLMSRFVNNSFSKSYKATVGADFATREVKVGQTRCTLQIWDTAGQERFQSLGLKFYRGADACILVYDITNPRSFDKLTYWCDEFKMQACTDDPETFPFVIVGNKTDRAADRAVSKAAAENWCREMGYTEPLSHFEASAATGDGVCEAFECAAQQAVKREAEDGAATSGTDFLGADTGPVRLGMSDRGSGSEGGCC